MRKLFSALTAAALCAALLAGCGDTSSTGTGNGANGAAAATATPDTTGDKSMTGEPTPTPAAGDTGSMSGDGTDAAEANGDAAADGGGATGTVSGTGADAAGTAYSVEDLNKALDGIVTVEGGSAGGSLQTAQAAVTLVAFAARCGSDSATLGADTKAWLDSLSEADRERLKQNWAAVRDRAHGICDDYDGSKGILADAGVTVDFSALDMSGVDAFLNTVDSVLGI